MRDADVQRHIEDRLAQAGLVGRRDLGAPLTEYVQLLAKWNQRINLTAYSLDHPSDEAIDRLIVEPVAMARFVAPEDRLTVDVGSGGGSPALPFLLAAPALRQVLIESRVRKAAFLREAVRTLGLTRATVENLRLDASSLPGVSGHADIVTMRAVRADAAISRAVRALLSPRGRFFWLTSAASGDAPPGFERKSVELLLPGSTSRLRIF